MLESWLTILRSFPPAGKFTAKSDVFSFGVTLWEIYTAAQEPWGDMMMADVLERLNDGKRLEQPARCPKPAYDVSNPVGGWARAGGAGRGGGGCCHGPNCVALTSLGHAVATV